MVERLMSEMRRESHFEYFQRVWREGLSSISSMRMCPIQPGNARFECYQGNTTAAVAGRILLALFLCLSPNSLSLARPFCFSSLAHSVSLSLHSVRHTDSHTDSLVMLSSCIGFAVDERNQKTENRCSEPGDLGSRFCINHRQDSQPLYKLYKAACDSFENLIVHDKALDVEDLSLAECERRSQLWRKMYGRAKLCKEGRARFTNDKVHPLARDTAHQQRIDWYENVMQYYDQQLQKIHARLMSYQARHTFPSPSSSSSKSLPTSSSSSSSSSFSSSSSSPFSASRIVHAISTADTKSGETKALERLVARLKQQRRDKIREEKDNDRAIEEAVETRRIEIRREQSFLQDFRGIIRLLFIQQLVLDPVLDGLIAYNFHKGEMHRLFSTFAYALFAVRGGRHFSQETLYRICGVLLVSGQVDLLQLLPPGLEMSEHVRAFYRPVLMLMPCNEMVSVVNRAQELATLFRLGEPLAFPLSNQDQRAFLNRVHRSPTNAPLSCAVQEETLMQSLTATKVPVQAGVRGVQPIYLTPPMREDMRMLRTMMSPSREQDEVAEIVRQLTRAAFTTV